MYQNLSNNVSHYLYPSIPILNYSGFMLYSISLILPRNYFFIPFQKKANLNLSLHLDTGPLTLATSSGSINALRNFFCRFSVLSERCSVFSIYLFIFWLRFFLSCLHFGVIVLALLCQWGTPRTLQQALWSLCVHLELGWSDPKPKPFLFNSRDKFPSRCLLHIYGTSMNCYGAV